MAASHMLIDLNKEIDSEDERRYIRQNYSPYTYEDNEGRVVYVPAQLPSDLSGDDTVDRYIERGVTLVSLVTDNLLSHPFQVLKRQCQVNHTALRYHIVPLTLLPTMYHLQQHQGITTFWKGLGSTLLVRGISVGIEDLIDKTTSWPKEVTSNTSVKDFFYHILLKCTSLAIVTPFFCASFIETVQSDVASEKPKMFDVFHEGFIRLLNWSGGYKGRMLPVWVIILPTITLGLAKYLFSKMIQSTSSCFLIMFEYKSNGTIPKRLSNKPKSSDLMLTASLIANISTDVIFYPFETIVFRLYLQGTRTIIDNLDNGKSVLPILTNYTGAVDCYNSCIASEGKLGLFKGFGALVLQYTVHIALIKLSRCFFTKIGYLIYGTKKPVY